MLGPSALFTTILPVLALLVGCGGSVAPEETVLLETSVDSGSAELPSPDSDAAVPRDACGPTPWILSGQVVNARGLGGVPLGEGRMVRCSTLYRGPHLSNLSDVGCAELASRGIKTVVDLRTTEEQMGLPEADCVGRQAAIVSAPLPVPYMVSPADYLADLYTTQSVATALHVASDPAAAPIYFHCTYGRDRTGIISAIVLSALGASEHEIQREYQLSIQSGVGAYPQSLQAVLDEIGRLGGIDAFLAVLGVPPSEVTGLRALATELPPPSN